MTSVRTTTNDSVEPFYDPVAAAARGVAWREMAEEWCPNGGLLFGGLSAANDDAGSQLDEGLPRTIGHPASAARL
jgi:hypothetical protein